MFLNICSMVLNDSESMLEGMYCQSNAFPPSQASATVQNSPKWKRLVGTIFEGEKLPPTKGKKFEIFYESINVRDSNTGAWLPHGGLKRGLNEKVVAYSIQ